MTDVDLRFVQYLDSIEHEYGYMLQTSAYVCPGWMQLIRDMLEEMHNETGTIDHPVLTTIKEKFGTLRVYGYNMSDEVQAIIDKYEKLSATICAECGTSGQMHVKHGWYYVACDEHANGGKAISWEDEE